MQREAREARHYAVSPLPSLRQDVSAPANQEVLLKLYDQVCATWRELVGVRFKLLALVPAVSLALLATVLSPAGVTPGMPRASRLLVALLGLASTFGLYVYDVRNSVLHDDLISRARRIEEELGVDTGGFRGRLKARRIFNHSMATNTIYFSAMLAWGVALWLTFGARGATEPPSHRSAQHILITCDAKRYLIGRCAVCYDTGLAFGPLAQLGERLVRNQEVGGSSPPRSTNLRNQACSGVSQG